MSTIKQQIAAHKIVENRGNVSKSMMQAGYSKTTAKNPSNLLDSKGFKDIAAQSGLDQNLIINCLVEDIKNKPGQRKQELELAAKLLGLFKQEDSIMQENKPNPIAQILEAFGVTNDQDRIVEIDGSDIEGN